MNNFSILDVFDVEDISSKITLQAPFTLISINNIYQLATRIAPGLKNCLDIKIGYLMSLVGMTIWMLDITNENLGFVTIDQSENLNFSHSSIPVIQTCLLFRSK